MISTRISGVRTRTATDTNQAGRPGGECDGASMKMGHGMTTFMVVGDVAHGRAARLGTPMVGVGVLTVVAWKRTAKTSQTV